MPAAVGQQSPPVKPSTTQAGTSLHARPTTGVAGVGSAGGCGGEYGGEIGCGDDGGGGTGGGGDGAGGGGGAIGGVGGSVGGGGRGDSAKQPSRTRQRAVKLAAYASHVIVPVSKGRNVAGVIGQSVAFTPPPLGPKRRRVPLAAAAHVSSHSSPA